MAKNKKNQKRGTFIHGIAASEHLDSSGERIKIDGIDISSLEEGYGAVFNWEHESKSSSSIVGKILGAKKVFRRADCETDAQKYFWDKIKIPFLYVWGELFDSVGHRGAQDVAAILKYDQLDPINKKSKQLINFSIEGARLDKRGSEITKCIARKISITIGPCNRVAGAEEYNPKDIKKIGSITSDGEVFSTIENLVDKSETTSIPSCQVMKGEFKPITTATGEHRTGKPIEPKRKFTPESAPKDMKVGDRIEYPKKPRAKTGKELYSEKKALAASEKGKITTPAKEMVDEHEKLVDVLESPSHKDDIKEAKKQKKELKEYRKKLKKKKKVKKMFVPKDANTFSQGVGKSEGDLDKAHIGEEVQRRIKQKQRPKQMARKPVRRVRPSKPTIGPKQNRMARLGMYDSNMRKAIAAGGMGGAPSVATQGEAIKKDNKKVKKIATAFENDAVVPRSKAFKSVDKSEALRIISNEAFNNFSKKEQLLGFLEGKLPGLTKKEILAIAKTVVYNYQKRKEVQLVKMLEKGDVIDINTKEKMNKPPKRKEEKDKKKDAFDQAKEHLNHLKDLHTKLKDLHSQLESEAKKNKE